MTALVYGLIAAALLYEGPEGSRLVGVYFVLPLAPMVPFILADRIRAVRNGNDVDEPGSWARWTETTMGKVVWGALSAGAVAALVMNPFGV